ncbi:EpsG family protein [Mucilaginibacter sp. MD40]|uniref:EpsG family protein n=1 Tax=Mucilaginibacter sp. MD40 TaxID=2029590 RepID=UPI001E4E1BC1|nr:EpsG family protein [Mucilaginibacter sp. MD40]
MYWFCVLLLLTIVCFKPIGSYPDDISYLDLLKYFRTDNLPEENQGRDYIYYYLAESLSFIMGDKAALISISLISISIKCFVIGKMSKYSLTALLVYIAFCVQLIDLTALRTSLSTAFIFLAIYYYSKKGYVRSAFYYICSFLSHIQTLLILPIFFMLHKVLYKYRYFIIVGSVAFGLLKLFPFGDLTTTGFAPLDLYLTQLHNGLEEKINLLRLSTIAALFLIIWIDYQHKNKSDWYKRVFMAALLSQLSIFLFYWFPVLAGRLADLLLSFMIIYFALSFRRINLYQKLAIIVIAFLININYMYVNPLFMRDGNPLAHLKSTSPTLSYEIKQYSNTRFRYYPML